MFKSFCNRFNTSMSRGCAFAANRSARTENMNSLLSMDTVIAVSIFAALRLIISLIGLIIRVIGVIIGNLISAQPDLAPAS